MLSDRFSLFSFTHYRTRKSGVALSSDPRETSDPISPYQPIIRLLSDGDINLCLDVGDPELYHKLFNAKIIRLTGDPASTFIQMDGVSIEEAWLRAGYKPLEYPELSTIQLEYSWSPDDEIKLTNLPPESLKIEFEESRFVFQTRRLVKGNRFVSNFTQLAEIQNYEQYDRLELEQDRRERRQRETIGVSRRSH